MYCLKYRPNQELLFFCDEHLQLAHLVSLEGDGDGEEDTGSETQVAEAFRQVVQPQWEACHTQRHLEISVKNLDKMRLRWLRKSTGETATREKK